MKMINTQKYLGISLGILALASVALGMLVIEGWLISFLLNIAFPSLAMTLKGGFALSLLINFLVFGIKHSLK
jgi:hypothetical protein